MDGGKEQHRSVDASLLRAVVDQFVERSMHPTADIRQFEPLALGLIDNIDSETVARVALPLCFHPETPSSIFARLFDKGGAAAALAFQFTPNFRQRDMMVTAERGPTPFAAAIARRRDLVRETMTALASRNEVEVLRALAGNLSAHLDAASRRALVMAARDDLTLARTLLDRDDLDLDPEPLFLAANRLERRAIVLHACRQILASGATETHCRANADFVAKLEGAAQRQDRGAMATLLSEALECRKDRARAVVADRLGEAFALALNAIGIPLESAARILWAEPHRSATIARSLVGLTRSTPQRAAARIVSAVTGAARSERENSRRATREEAGAPTWRRAAAPQPVARPSRKLDQSA
ncbi:DUF2336 domain-containing protein [Methylocystis sp. B8]|uniref:DUF2336 domain-containing protein n=1 Tax=Methylocystis sp. B8 TaxID=544938 RepID=UPI0010FEE687|nr:DUF2336 domain-containing protein [Methylocystis sp. B8]TLG78742.1 DUF2336 domain-containing protein [Methylocystis sp. B8]